MAQVLARHRERELAERLLSVEDVRRRRRQWGGILAAAAFLIGGCLLAAATSKSECDTAGVAEILLPV